MFFINCVIHVFFEVIDPWRNFRYDSTIQEYFVQTSETVKIRKSDIETHRQVEQVEDMLKPSFF